MPWPVLFAGLAHAVVLVAVLRGGLSFPRLTATARSPDSGVRPERLTFTVLDAVGGDHDANALPRPTGALGRAESRAQDIEELEAIPPGAGSPGTESGAEGRPSPTPLDHPFLRLPDRRLMLGPSRVPEQLTDTRAAIEDSLRPVIARDRAARNWTVPLGAGRIGLATEWLHLGPLAVPMRDFTSLHDLDPQVRAQHAMQREVREQAERVWRDSIVAARRKP